MRTPAFLLIVLALAAVAQAANVTLSPTTIYETTTPWETIDVNNYKGSSVIQDVEVNSPTLQILAAESYTGWTKIQDADSVEWKDGSIETNVKSAVFEFQVSAPNITTNTTATITLSLDSSTVAYNITILNDASPPTITETKPSTYAKANNAAQAISAKATDAETSVSSVTYAWNDCSNGTTTTIILTKSNDTYTGVAGFTGYDEGEKACYTYTATNTPGEKSTKTGELLFDGTPPSVSINSPTTFATESTTFSFNATDNIAPTLACVLKLDSTELGTYTAVNGTTTTATLDLSNFTEGSYTWSVTCADGVGLTATHAQAIILDTKFPAITLNTNPFLPRTQTGTFTANATDTIGLASVISTFDGNNVTLTQSGTIYTGSISSDALGTKTLQVKATDDAGHITTKTQNITIIPNHLVTLALSPATAIPGETITASGTLAKDGNATADEVTVKTPGGDITANLTGNAYSTTFTAPSTGTYTITTEYAEGGYTYKATAALTVQSASTPQQQIYGSHGPPVNWPNGPGYVKPKEEKTEPTSGGNNQQTEQTEQPSQPRPSNYVPRQPEPPRGALTPKATGIFNLGKNVKWFALLLALALLAGIGAYAYKKRKPKDENGIDWNGYFKGNGT